MGADCAREFTVYKRGPARRHYTIIRLKTQFVQLLTDPKRIDQFTVISALLSTPNICMILSDIPLLLRHLIALVSSGSTGEQHSGAPDASGGGGMIITKPG